MKPFLYKKLIKPMLGAWSASIVASIIREAVARLRFLQYAMVLISVIVLTFTKPAIAGVPAMFTDVVLPYRIYSSPVTWQSDTNTGMAFAVVIGEANGEHTSTTVDAFYFDGHRASGFPVRGDLEISPGNQIIGGGRQSTPMVIDMSGRCWSLPKGRYAAKVVTHGHPTIGLLAAPALVLDSGSASDRGYLLVSRNFEPHIDSLNALAVLDRGGNLIAGYPVTLPGIPESLPPIIAPSGEKAWVMLRSGQIVGVNLADGSRLLGFPTAIHSGNRPPGGFRLAMSNDGSLLFVSQGTSELLRVDARTGQMTALKIKNAQSLTGIAFAGEKLYTLDEISGRLLVLDRTGHELFGFDISASGGFRNVLMTKLALPSNTFLILSTSHTDQASLINQLYAERAPSQVKMELSEKIKKRIQKDYGATPMTTEQQEEMDNRQLMLKQGWLQKTIGITPLMQLMTTPPATRVQVVTDSGNGFVALLDDIVSGFIPETGFAQSDKVLPSFQMNLSNGAPKLLVPLNAAASRRDSKAYYRSLVRIYTLPTQ